MPALAGPASAESGRVLGNLSRLAALRQAFQQLDTTPARDEADAPAGSPSAAADAPAEWGHLRIVESLGRGGFGDVFRAYDPLLEREVALKLRREDRTESTATRAYIEEARRLARVRHPNVLAVHGAGIHDGRAGLWVDLIQGESLEQQLASGPLSRDELLALARQLLEALGAIHAAGLVHGDLKAANVMFDGEHAVLMDFGAAHAVGERPRQGSYDCMAPELLAGERGDARSDLYALGALLRRAAMAPESPVAGKNGSVRRQLGRSFASLIDELTASNPARRPDAASVARQLRRIATAPARRRRRLGIALVIASLLLGLLASLFALHRVREARDQSDRIKELLVAGIQHSAPTRQSGPASLRTLLDYLAEEAPGRLEAFPGALADMRVVIGAGLSDLGHHQEGLAIAEQGLRVLREQPGVSDLHLANSLSVIAVLRGKVSGLQQGEGSSPVASAREAAEQAIRLLERLPEDDRDRRVGMIRTRSLLGNLRSDDGDWLGAVSAHRANLADRAALLGEDAPQLAVDEYNLATAQSMCGDNENAVANFERAATRLRDAGAADSSRMAYVLHGQAVALMRLGRLQESAASADRAAALYERVLDPQHPAVRRLQMFRTEWLRVSGDPQQAYARYRDSIADPVTSELLNTGMRLYAVDMLIDAGRHAEARAELEATRDKLRPRDAPLLPYIEAAGVWIDSRLGESTTGDADAVAAATTIRAAIARMREAGYGRLPRIARMAAWAEQLDP